MSELDDKTEMGPRKSPDPDLPTNPNFGTAEPSQPAPALHLSDRALHDVAQRFDLLNELGRGGMGIVYRARDRETSEIIALKVLNPEIATRPDLIESFKTELRLARKITHKNVCRSYDLHRFGDTVVIAMEYVEGESLRAALNRIGGVSLRGGKNWASQICAALAEAHAQGIVHRDLKPENIVIDSSGQAKVMDFGIARSLDTTTIIGVMTGTPAYMSPEQAEGKPADARSDIYSLGLILYEMFTGRPGFKAESPIAMALKQIHETPPPPREVEPHLPPFLDRVIQRCLEKNPKQRFQSVTELGAALDEQAVLEPALTSIGAPIRAGNRLKFAAAVAGAVLGSILTGLIVWRILSPQATAPSPVTRFAVTLPSGDQLANMDFPALALSPDGSELVYAAGHGDVNQLYLRSLNQMDAKPIAGTEGASNPFFSPDGQWVGFFARGELKKVSIQGGPSITICDIPYINGGASWGADNTIVYSATPYSGLFQVSGSGGTPRPVTTVNRHQGELTHRWPQVLPGGEVLFNVRASVSWDDARIEIASLKTGERRVLVEGGTFPRYVAPGYILYSHGGDLVAVPFDLKQLKVTGPPAPVLEGVRVDPTSGAAQFAFSESGSLAFVPGGAFLPLSTLVWVDRNGKEEPLGAPPGAYSWARLSPDGRRVAIWIGSQGTNSDIWVYDLARRTLTRLTTDGDSINPASSPDGKRVVYSSVREQDRPNLFWANPDGSGDERLTTSSEWAQVRPSFSPDGRFLAFIGVQRLTGYHDIQILPLEGNRKPQPLHQTQFHEDNPMFSPDGHWIAYTSDETGRFEVYIRSYPGSGEKLQVSTQGGGPPVWSRDGRELFYRSGNKMMAVTVSSGPALKLGEPQLLFEGDFGDYDVAPDGKRFLMIKSQPSPPVTQINVVENWIEDLKRGSSTNIRQ